MSKLCTCHLKYDTEQSACYYLGFPNRMPMDGNVLVTVTVIGRRKNSNIFNSIFAECNLLYVCFLLQRYLHFDLNAIAEKKEPFLRDNIVDE